jgi:hypothetical protein
MFDLLGSATLPLSEATDISAMCLKRSLCLGGEKVEEVSHLRLHSRHNLMLADKGVEPHLQASYNHWHRSLSVPIMCNHGEQDRTSSVQCKIWPKKGLGVIRG